MNDFSSISVAVLGDVILDEYVYGRVTRLSPEAPVPVLEVRNRVQSLGGAGNVAVNVASLGGKAALFAVVGDDASAGTVRSLATAHAIDHGGLLVDVTRPTTTKQRVGAQTQQIVRIDSETVDPIDAGLSERLGAAMEKAADSCHVLVISDYDKGVVTPELLTRSVAAFRSCGKPIVVDPNVTNFFSYGEATVVTPNHLEFERVSGKRIRGEEALFAAGREIRARLGRSALLITRGEEGMALIDDVGILKIPTVAREVYDVTGAGDTVVSTLALGLGAGLALPEASKIANAAAGIVVGKRGTASVTRDELEKMLHGTL